MRWQDHAPQILGYGLALEQRNWISRAHNKVSMCVCVYIPNPNHAHYCCEEDCIINILVDELVVSYHGMRLLCFFDSSIGCFLGIDNGSVLDEPIWVGHWLSLNWFGSFQT